MSLASITITSPANKLIYIVGDTLDITGLEVTGTYSDTSTKIETITLANITGFNSSLPGIDQVLTITVDGQTTAYIVHISGIRRVGSRSRPTLQGIVLGAATVRDIGDL